MPRPAPPSGQALAAAEPAPPARVLVTGASGLLGTHLCAVLLAEGHEVIAVSHAQTLPESLATYRIRQDLCDRELLPVLLQNLRPSAVIHAAALADPQQCEEQPLLSRRLNVELTRQLAQLCAERRLPMAFTSTDLVFDGRRGNYSEHDPVNPINRYGEHKAEAEQLVRQEHPGALVLRLPLMFGRGGLRPSPLETWLEQLDQGQTLNAFVDEFRSAVDYRTAAQGIVHTLFSQSGRLLHLGGIETLSRHQLVARVAQLFGRHPEQVATRRQAEFTFRAARPRDVSLDSRIARSLGYRTPFLDEMLIGLRDD